MADIGGNPISSKDWRREIGWVVLLQVVVIVCFMLPEPEEMGKWTSIFLGSDIKTYKTLLTILMALGIVALTVFAVKRLKDLTWAQSLQFLGFKKPKRRQIIIGTISCLLVVFYCLYNNQRGTASFTPLSWQETAYLFIVAGLYEETFYRGFIFRLFRQNLAFLPAAILAGIFWAIPHAEIYLYVFRLYPYRLAFLLTLVLLMSIPAAYLFENGGNVIWGWMITHVGYDYILEMFPDNPPCDDDGYFVGAQPQILALVVLMGLVTWGLSAWLLPSSPKRLEVKNLAS